MRMFSFIAVALIGIPGYVGAQTLAPPTLPGYFPAAAKQPTDPKPSELSVDNTATINRFTRWAFQSKTDVQISSHVVRLSDIIEPLDPHLAAWQRLAQSPIGLVPIGGQVTTIDRDRLSSIILSAEATPRTIDWYGPKKIRVSYRPKPPTTPAHLPTNSASYSPTHQGTPANNASYVRQASAQGGPSASLASPVNGSEGSGTRDGRPLQGTTTTGLPNRRSVKPLSTSDKKRIVHWVEVAIKRYQPEIADKFAVEVPRDQPSFESLRKISGVNECSPLKPITEGATPFEIQARAIGGPVTGEVLVNLTAHPMAVVPRRPLARGERISQKDVKLVPIPAEKLNEDAVRSFDEVIGKEVRSTLRPDQTISVNKIGSPILIHRGELVEIRVRGGGVNVTTNGKAMSSGSRNQLIEVETLRPKKRLVARVAEVGVAEIITRAPVVR